MRLSVVATMATVLGLVAIPALAAVPQAFDASFQTKIDTPVFVFLDAFDPDFDSLTYTVTGGPSSGSLDDCSPGFCTYTPNTGFLGTDSFTFTASDGTDSSNEATVTIDVTPNQAPVASDGAVTTKVDTPVFVFLDAFDPDFDSLTYTVTGGPSSGSLDDCSSGFCTYTPNTGFIGSDSFTFTVSDGDLTSNEATVTIEVQANTAPVAVDGVFGTSVDSPVGVFLEASDPNGDPLSFTVTGGPSNGSLDDCTAGFCTYTPDGGFIGTDSFAFTAWDGELSSNEATVTINVNPPCAPAVCIDNGTILLAINPEAHLNTQDATGSPAGPGDAGLHFIPTGNESTSPGCLCEGWGAADAGSAITGYANISSDGGAVNLDLQSFSATSTTALSVVTIDDTLSVTHDFHPSAATANLYEVTVTIENITTSTLDDIRYRRVMDWDIEPTPFSEFVTIDGGSAANLLFSSDNGFETGNPLGSRSDLGSVGSFVDSGPADHGALFDFGFGALGAGEAVTFNIYYGAADTETGAISAVAAVGAEVYSFGQPNTEDGPTLGTPNTFIFAFAGVGGEPVFAPTAVDDVLTTTQDTAADVDVLANDSDPNGDPLEVVSSTDAANGTASCTPTGICTYTPNPGFSGTDSFTYTISDGTGGAATATVRVTVEVHEVNLPPVVDAGGDVSGVEGSAIGLDATISDPDGDPLTLSWSYMAGVGVDAGATCSFSDPTVEDPTITCTDDGTYAVTLSASDGTNPPVQDSATVTITNADPTVDITSPGDGSTFLVGATVNLSASLADPGANDTHTCSIDWGDGTTTDGTVTAGTCTGSHTYATIGVPTVLVTVTDDDGGIGTDEIMLIISAPGTKVTGGGWLLTPDGTRVSIGLVADGTEGQLQVRVHNSDKFHGTDVDGVIATGTTATWTGPGRWNGQDGYTYQVTVGDNGNGSSKKGSPDTFSITIYDHAATVVWTISAPLAGGNLRIH